MGVYIKGMRMPENCSECPVALSGKYCRINKTFETFKALPIRPNHCPLVALPEKHGRLIDADMLMDDVKKNSVSFFAEDFAREWLDVQPTVIEAEGE